MPYPRLDRQRLLVHPLRERENKICIERDRILPGSAFRALSAEGQEALQNTVLRMRAARAAGAPVVLAFGAHAIKNGLGPVLIRLIEDGWIQHLATNGAGIIHDWEFAFQGASSEDVRANTAQGRFGIWEETGYHLNLALLLGAYDGLGYGESVGRLIHEDRHLVPRRHGLLDAISRAHESPAAAESAAAAADLLAAMEQHGIVPGLAEVPHPWKRFSVQAAAYRLGVPFTAHPMIGHDIIYTHPLSRGAAVGRTAERDFLTYAHAIAALEGGVYLSVGSAVMSPMIFEKSMSMAQNLALQGGRSLGNHLMVVVDLAASHWDWSQGEPPPESPDYYLRYCKTFSRMGGTLHYVTADNRDFLLALCAALGVAAEQQRG